MIMIRLLTSALLLFIYGMQSYAQGSICGATIPITNCPADTHLCFTELSDSTVLVTPSNLPNLEYAIVDLNVPSTANTGPAIIAVVPSSQFIPMDVGIDSTTILEVFPIAYDLVAIQETLDDILKGLIFGFIPCCTVAPDVCDQLTGAGINCGSDFTSLSQAFALFSADTNILFSIDDFIDGIDSVNMTLADPNIPSECGGGDVICYAYGLPCLFEVNDFSTSIPLLSFSSPHVVDTMARAQSFQSSAIVTGGLDVAYLFNTEVDLISGFETINSSSFLIQKEGCQP